MKKLILYALLIAGCIGCSDDYDDSKLWDSVNGLENRVAKLEELCKQMNTNISSLQEIVTALQKNDSIKSVATLPDGSGYLITFSSGKTITIYHGKNGEDGKDGHNGTDGVTPTISVRKDTDGVYYWTVNNDWLLVDGKKVKAEGADGADGKPGIDGEDGTNGKDGITPQFKIEDGYWYISYDNEQSWTKLGKATGDSGLNGTDGDNFFKGVSIEDGYVCFTLNDKDSSVIKLPFVSESELTVDVKEPGTLKSLLTDEDMRTVISLKIKGSLNEDDFATIRYWMFVVENVDLSETTISKVPEDAFREMPRLKKMVLPKSCVEIGKNAFYNCRILSYIETPGALVPASAINFCNNLVKLICANIDGELNNSNLELVLMGDNLGKITLPIKGTTTIITVKKLVFESSTTEITNIPQYDDINYIEVSELYFASSSKISTIRNGIFVNNKNLRKITFPNALTTLECYAFHGCTNLSEIIFPDECALTELRYSTSYYRDRSIFTGTNLKTITFPKNISTIAGNVFYGVAIEKIIFAESDNYCQLTYGTYSSKDIYGQSWTTKTGVFENLKSLKEIICYRTYPPVCSQYAFESLDEQFFYNCILYVPKTSLEIYKADSYWSKFKRILPIEE